MPLFLPPRDYPRLRLVHSVEELLTTPFDHGVNALCWQRTLEGDFQEVIEALGPGEGILSLDENSLHSLALSNAGKTAVTLLLEDQKLLQSHGLNPSLDCIYGYERDSQEGPLPTDVYSFHADSATVETDTFLCSYTAPSSQALRNEEAIRCVDLPEIRAKLLQSFGGSEGEAFEEFLQDHCYPLHYAAAPHATPFSFGTGNLWRIAVEYPGCPVPPCIHRAPPTLPGQAPRLLLIS